MRNCSERAISHFPTVFSTRSKNFLPLSSNLKSSSTNTLHLEESKIGRFGKLTVSVKALAFFFYELCQLFVVIYKTRCRTFLHTKRHQSSFIGNFHIFCHRNENDDDFVVFCSDLSFHWRVPRGSVVRCLTRNPGTWVRASLDPLGFFVGVSLGKTLQSLA